MPVLKSYADCSGYYIHASVHGAVVTFQTTQRGVEKLAAAGVQPGTRQQGLGFDAPGEFEAVASACAARASQFVRHRELLKFR